MHENRKELIEIEMVWVIVDKSTEESEENERQLRFLNKSCCERKFYNGSMT